MRRSGCGLFSLLAVAFLFAPSAVWATTWKLVLKSGKTIECEGAPVIVNDAYLFRNTDGEDVKLPADQVDREKTNLANGVVPRSGGWQMKGELVKVAPAEPRVAVKPAKERPPAAAPVSASAGVLSFSDASFQAEVLNSPAPVLVAFWATWCRYCRMMAPVIDALAVEYAGRVKVGKLDIDRNRATARRYGIQGTPTLMLFKQGQVAGVIDGAAEKSEVVQLLRSGS